jgi:hypothetical protein
MRAPIALTLFATVALAAPCRVYTIIDGAEGNVLWHSSEAFFFVGIRHIGHNVSCFRFPWFFAKGFLGGVEDPDNDMGELIVLRITSSGSVRHVQRIAYEPPGAAPGMYTPLDGRIYANYPALGGLCWWAGDHFEKATAEERQRLGGISHLTNRVIEQSKDGWSKRLFGVFAGDSDNRFFIDVGNFRVTTSDLGGNSNDRVLSINITRPKHDQERAWSVQLHSGSVIQSVYEQVFEEHRQ